MVSRKPVPNQSQGGGSVQPSSAPYPVSPTTSEHPPPFRVQDAQNALRHDEDGGLEDGEANAWSEERTGAQLDEPAALPPSLRVGPPGGIKPQPSREVMKDTAFNSNPFLRNQGTGDTPESKESSAGAWEDVGPSRPPPPPPVTITQASPLGHKFSNLSVAESNTNPWQPALNEKAASTDPSKHPPLSRGDSGNEAWSEARPDQTLPSDVDHPVLVDIDTPESPAWDEDSIPSPTIQEMPASPVNVRDNNQLLEDQNAWGESLGQGKDVSPKVATPFVAREEPLPQGEGWNIVEREPPTNIGSQQTGIVNSDGTVLEQHAEDAPALPPRPSTEFPPPQPPRPVASSSDADRSAENPPTQPARPTVNTDSSSTPSIPHPTSAEIQVKNKETYEIKKITWHDVTSPQNPRISPILVQNKNGPCPLLALVNALTLSTPSNVQTALVETLRSREQVSLGLLLDAVFDELMSGRRGDAVQGLPDVTELYAFLLALHTGMNVNPRFFPPAPNKTASDPRNSMSHVHPADREAAIPGTFEDTREMQLYSTFSIPLIHGWLPDRDSSAYMALKRTSQSYEDAQNIFFQEEVLEEKLRSEGLSFEEQSTLEDISTIKAFFKTAATQLTSYGLETITTSIAPGAVAILFRNDHFSTLYRHPQTLQLLQLVTDMGYAGHEEVVWESLIDVNGENAEFFSGDFRLVGGTPASPSHSRTPSHSNDGWNPVATRNQNNHRQTLSATSNDLPQMPHSPNNEQEDHDLALALQMQEEEEERHRNEIDRRRRETELSQQYIEQQGHGNNVPVTQRRGGGAARGNRDSRTAPPHNRNGPVRGSAEVRPAVPPRRANAPAAPRPIDPEAGVDMPPPSYEQAATEEAYVPPVNHPAHPNSSPTTSRTPSVYADQAALNQRLGSPTQGGRRTTLSVQADEIRRLQNNGQPPGSPNSQTRVDRNKDCAIM